ncbi:aspartate--tRNA ligase [bacterium (Candidatus Torokbacteria) CG_4_10_14_0_2_um_filter_35_8]|nr:MAG: aspartate--tRNA ligase [bacterium (Candidatus Torokbacteria) CG_4_10_14_0_2_um_filter_35_8]
MDKLAFKSHYCGLLTEKNAGEEIIIAGWVHNRRDHGKLIFFDLRDKEGIVQVIVNPKTAKDAHRQAKKVRQECVLQIEGIVKKRAKGLENKDLETGKVEVEAKSLKILAKSEPLPFSITSAGYSIDENVRLKYRYLDLRRRRLLKNLIFRHKFLNFIRKFLTEKGFIEVETPILTKPTPEGARDFLVPSRLQPGNFYALPQSPQQYKQLLMISGIEKYFQIARCFRDEDLRADRQLEFTQIDMEMSFVEQDDVLNIVEEMVIAVVEAITNKKIQKKPFPRLSYEEAISRYNSDKPDLRKNKNNKNTLAFAWITDFPMFEWNEEEKKWDAMHHPFTMPKKDDLQYLESDPKKVKADAYDLVCNGFEVAGGSVRITDSDLQEKILGILGIKKEKAQEKFGHLLEAYKYGGPPHAGIAPGVDRICAILSNENNIREVIPFPVNSAGETSIMDAPSPADKKQLFELHLRVTGVKESEERNSFEELKGYLNRNKIKYKLYHHKPVKTSEEAAKVRGCKLEQGAKALVLKTDKENIMAVLPGDKKLDSSKFKNLFGFKLVDFLDIKNLKEVTGCDPGGVHPFGNLFNLPVFFDEDLLKNKELYFNAGTTTDSISMSTEDYLNLMEPKKGKFGK